MSLGIGLVESFSEFKEFKNIDRATMIRVMEDVFRSMLKRRYGDDSNFDVIVNDKTGMWKFTNAALLWTREK